METEIKSWLNDIADAIIEIDSFLAGKPKDFHNFKNDILVKRAIERNIEIIGEAMKRILDKSPYIKLSYSRQIVNTRNRIIHGYDTISDEIIWGIVIKHLPTLQSEVENLLKQ